MKKKIMILNKFVLFLKFYLYSIDSIWWVQCGCTHNHLRGIKLEKIINRMQFFWDFFAKLFSAMTIQVNYCSLTWPIILLSFKPRGYFFNFVNIFVVFAKLYMKLKIYCRLELKFLDKLANHPKHVNQCLI